MAGYFQVIVVLTHVFHALAFQFGNAIGVKYQLFKLVKNTIVSRGYVDDRT